MKRKILEKSIDMFLNFGFKSVTMDDIALEMAMSKKTLYKFYSNKAALVHAATVSIQESIDEAILLIKAKNYNAIEEEFTVKATFNEMFKNTKNYPMFQLKKYYPDTYSKLIERQVRIFKDCNLDNLTKGIEQGFYRREIKKELIGSFYFTLIFGIFERNTRLEIQEILKAEYEVLEYHIRAIATDKGIQELEKQLKIINQK